MRCPHKWKLIKEDNLVEDLYMTTQGTCNGFPIVGKVTYLQCEFCERTKKVKTKYGFWYQLKEYFNNSN